MSAPLRKGVGRGPASGTTMDSLPMASLGGTASPQYQEFVLFGSVKETHVPVLIERLRGLCDPSWVRFDSEHEMILSQKAGEHCMDLRIRRNTEDTGGQSWWHFYYIGVPDAGLTKTCQTIVRKRIDSKVCAPNMMEFVRSLGFRYQYEFVANGWVFTKGHLKITVSQINKTKAAGNIQDAEPVSSSRLVECSVVILQGSEEPTTVAKAIRDFADQLKPIVNMEKIDYTAIKE